VKIGRENVQVALDNLHADREVVGEPVPIHRFAHAAERAWLLVAAGERIGVAQDFH
jgi:hypothetical protein